MKQPQFITPDSVDMVLADRRTLQNGTNIHTLQTNDFEVLRITFVFMAGTSVQKVPFSASATANMLSEGSRDMTAHQIAEKIDYYGSYFDVNIDRDCTYITFCCLSKFTEQTLEVAEQIILYPTFVESELNTYCTKRKQQLSIERTKVNIRGREAFSEALFGKNHPYGTSAPTEAYDTLKREDLISFYNNFYTADNCFVVCSGQITDDVRTSLDRLVNKLPKRKAVASVEFPEAESCLYRFVEHKNALQSSIYIGKRLFTRTHPDFLGMQVTTTILGGYFGSRLMQNLREQRGYTYGVLSAMINFEKDGYLAIATQVGTDVTQDALKQIYIEIERLRVEMVTEEELALVKNIIIGEMMRIIDGPFGIADITIENILCGYDNNIIATNIKRINEMTPKTILELAQKYLKRDELTTVIAGVEGDYTV